MRVHSPYGNTYNFLSELISLGIELMKYYRLSKSRVDRKEIGIYPQSTEGYFEEITRNKKVAVIY